MQFSISLTVATTVKISLTIRARFPLFVSAPGSREGSSEKNCFKSRRGWSNKFNEAHDHGRKIRWYSARKLTVTTSRGYPSDVKGGEEDITSKGATLRNLNESKVPTSLLLKLVSQRERNRVFSSMLLDRVSDGFVVDTESHIYIYVYISLKYDMLLLAELSSRETSTGQLCIRFSPRHEIYLPSLEHHFQPYNSV